MWRIRPPPLSLSDKRDGKCFALWNNNMRCWQADSRWQSSPNPSLQNGRNMGWGVGENKKRSRLTRSLRASRKKQITQKTLVAGLMALLRQMGPSPLPPMSTCTLKFPTGRVSGVEEKGGLRGRSLLDLGLNGAHQRGRGIFYWWSLLLRTGLLIGLNHFIQVQGSTVTHLPLQAPVKKSFEAPRWLGPLESF